MEAEAMQPTPLPFQPWKKNLQNGFIALGLLGLIWLAYSLLSSQHEKLLIAGGIVCSYALWQFHQASVRSFGQRLERSSIKKLASVLGPENVKGNLPFPGHGDIDCVARINNVVFNIEIKSFREIQKISRAHINQTLAASHYLDTKPVIWLPNFKETQFGMRNGVMLCACDAKRLFRKLR